MPGAYVGKLGIRVFPDTSKFRSELGASLKLVEKSVRGIKVGIKVDTSGLNKLRADIAKSASSVIVAPKVTPASTSKVKSDIEGTKPVVEVKPILTEAEKAALRARVAAIRASITAHFDDSKLKQQMNSLSASVKSRANAISASANSMYLAASKKITTTIGVALDTRSGRAAVAGVESIRTKVSNIKSRIDFVTDSQSVRDAKAVMGVVGRTIKVAVRPFVDSSAVARVKSELATIDGGEHMDRLSANVTKASNALSNMSRSFVGAIGSVGRFSAAIGGSLGSSLSRAAASLTSFTMRTSAAAVSIASVGAAGITAVAGIGQFAAALGALGATLGPLALAAPALVSGIAVALAGFKDAFKEGKKQMEEYVTKVNKVRDISAKTAVEVARIPVTSALDKLLPILEQSATKVGTAIGNIVSEIARVGSSASSLGSVQTFFDNITKALDLLAPAAGNFTEALISLTGAGSRYLPQLAQWITDISERFNAWVTDAINSGNMFDWIDGSLATLKTLGSMLSDIGGIISGVYDAASDQSGLSILNSYAAALSNLNAAVNGPAVQAAIGTLVSGAGTAMSTIMSTFGQLLSSLGSVSGQISQIMVDAAGSVGSIGDAIANVIGSGLADGLVSMFSGIRGGAEQLSLGISGLGPMLEALGGLFGRVAENLGGVLGSAITMVSPLITRLATALQPVVDQLGGALMQIIPALQPLLSGLVDVFVSMLPAVGPLAEAIAVVLSAAFRALADILVMLQPYIDAAVLKLQEFAPTIAELIAGGIQSLPGILGSIATALGPVVGFITSLVAKIGEWVMANPTLIAALGVLLPAIGPIISGIGTLGTIISTVASTFGILTNVVGLVGAALGALSLPVVAAVSVVGLLAAGIYNAWQSSETFRNAVAGLGESLVGFIQPFVDFFTNTVIPKFNELWQTIKTTLAGIQESLTPFLTSVAELITMVLDKLKPLVGYVLDVLTPAFNGFMDAVGSVFRGVGDIIKGALDIIRGVIDMFLGAVSGDWARVWEGFKTVVSGVGSALKGIFGGTLGALVDLIGGFGQSFIDVGINLMKALARGIIDMASAPINAVKDVASNVVDGAKGMFGINSPSRVFRQIGVYNAEGLAIGMEREASRVLAGMNAMLPDPSGAGLNFDIGAAFSSVDGSRGTVDPNEGARNNGGTTVNVYNPINEPTSQSVRRHAARLIDDME